MIAMDWKDGNGNVNIWIFVVDSRKTIFVSRDGVSAGTTHENPGVDPSIGSLKSSNYKDELHDNATTFNLLTSIGLSPRVNSLSSAMVWCIHVRLGLFSWNKSPARRMKSTSWSFANSNISRKVLIESCPRTGSFSAYPIWLSVAMRIRKQLTVKR